MKRQMNNLPSDPTVEQPKGNPRLASPQVKNAVASAKSDGVDVGVPSVWWQWPGQGWNNLSFRWKLTLFLMITAMIPVLAVTSLLNKLAGDQFIRDLQAAVSDKNLLFTEEYLLWTNEEAKAEADSLVQAVQTSGVNLSQPAQVVARRAFLQSLLPLPSDVDPESIKSFKILTDAKGKTVAQSIQVLDEDFSKNPLLPTPGSLALQKYRLVSLPPGIPLGDVPIVKTALRTGQPLAGMELVKGADLQRLGLDQQAFIPQRPQVIKGLAEPKQPFPKGTFDIDGGKVGLVSMAVYPIRLKGQLVGTAIVGSLLNRNQGIADKFTSKYPDIPVATIFAQDWRVATTIPYVNPATKQKDGTRAIGTLASREVANKVLNQGEPFFGPANIVGLDYLTAYRPLYDHRKALNPQIKPIGFSFSAKPITDINAVLRQQQLLGYGVGVGSLLLIGLVALPLAGTFSRPLRRLSSFAEQVGTGKSDFRLAATDRRDEIGVLTRSLNEMAQNIQVNLEARQQETEQQRQQREILEKEIFQIVEEVEGAAAGDLTVRATLTAGEMGTVADLFNAIVESLRDIAIQVKQSAGQVSTSLTENEGTIRDLADTALAEVAEIRNTLGSMEQMSTSIQAVATNAQAAEAISDTAYQTVQSGNRAMDQAVASILNLRSTVGETAKKMKRLGESSQKISQVVSLIDEIALKTSLLAINASVEAKRAGEQGQGFTVVAEQVGILAEQSAAATKEIAQIVAGIQAETQEVSAAMELGTTQVVDSTRLVEVTKQQLGQVLQRSQEINQLMQSISKATVSQAETSQTVTNLMQQVTQTAEARSLFSRQVAQTIQETAQVAKELESTVDQFKVNDPSKSAE
jgi:methyl-accepting chemotaxis protein